MAAAQMSKLHGAHSWPRRAIGPPRRRGGASSERLACSPSSSSSLSRGAWPSSSGAIRIESSSRLCSPVVAAASVCGTSLEDVEGDDATSMEWLSPGSGNPMDEWLRKGDEREGDAWREECGVVAIFGNPKASRLCYLSLHALQHKGQEGAGIVTANEHTLHVVTGMGLVSEVFDGSKLQKLPGSSAIGHVRYATARGSVLKNVQPFVAGYRFGSLAVAHSGNLVNYSELLANLEEIGSIFNTSSDTEVILHLIAISKKRSFLARLIDACEQLEGAYSLVFLSEDKVVAVRDPHGFRPLVMGRKSNGAYVFASEMLSKTQKC